MGQLIVPLGIATFISLVLTIIFGMFKKIVKPRWRIKIHKSLGLVTLGIASVHAGIVVYLYYL